ncbi:MAG TPA: single-stranded-DNA-specific exonuclease RecJ [Thermoflexales bacterium]|nr:single-stranded-DNA-specific exonuclease RecJ [Thermoflexales bacterium]
MTEQQLAAALGGNPLIAHLLWQRGYQTLEEARGFLDPDAFTPTSPFDLPGMAEAVARLRQAIARGEKILIWGDFDVDGQTATSVLLLGLRAAGANAAYSIPDRATHSHGLNKPGLAQAREQGAKVLLTCDCGVTDFEEVEFARRLGFDVIITDHHDLADHLPDALAVINPKRLPPSTPLANLPGVGVAYKLIEALGQTEDGRPMTNETTVSRLPSPVLGLLDLVALGIVSDLAYMRGDTRYLLQRGLAQLRSSARAGIRALMRVSGLEASTLTTDDIGFQIGPRLNAIGRLDKAEMGVRLLITEDDNEARELAARIEELNAERKIIQRKVEDDAARMIERNPSLIRQPVIILQSEDWHPSVIGIAASGLARRFNRPAMLIAARAGEVGRGSARSVEGVDIHAAIADSHGLVLSSGGHPMAAGFGIHSENIPAFRDAIGQHVRKQVEAATAGGVLPRQRDLADAVVDWSENWMPLAAELERLAPFGAGNPRPILMSRNLSVSRTEPVGKDGSHRAVFLRDEAGRMGRAIWWGSGSKPVPDGALDVAFTLEMNSYRGRTNAQARVEALLPREETSPPAAPVIGAKYAIVDLRGALDRAAELRGVFARHGAENVQVFAELAPLPAKKMEGGQWVTRLTAQPAPVLVFWESPPNAAALRHVLDVAQPQEVVLLTALGESSETPEAVAKQIAAMKNTAQKRGDALDDPQVIERMAARVGQRVETVRAGLSGQSDQLRYWLEETRAYRGYFQVAGALEVVK